MDTDTKEYYERLTMTHATQVERFGWCICEDLEQGQLAPDCPRATEEKYRECIECFRMYDEPENEDDTCRLCQDGGR